MTVTVPASHTLNRLAEATRVLHDDAPFAVRVRRLFEIVHTVANDDAARLICWFQSAQPGTGRQQFHSRNNPNAEWSDALTRQVALTGRIDQHTIEPSPERSQSQKTYLGAPAIWNGRLWGVLEMQAQRSDAFAGPVRELVAALLPQLAVAIAREGEQQADAHQIEVVAAAPLLPHETHTALAALEYELGEPLTLHQLLNTLLRQALNLSRAEAGAVCLVDHEHQELVIQAFEGYPQAFHRIDLQNGQRQRWSLDRGLAGRAVRQQRALLVRDVTHEPWIHANGLDVHAELAVPIIVQGQVQGVVILDSPRSAAFGDNELALVRTLCERAAQPLSRALQYQEALEASTYLGQVFNSLPTGLALLDSSGKVLRSNPAWARLWGIRKRTNHDAFHVAIDLIDVLLPRLDDPLGLLEFCAEEQYHPTKPQETTIRLNSPTQDLHIHSLPTADTQKQIAGRLWVVDDVTREREVDRLKGEFVATVSHELRTPLTSILGYTELLLNRNFSKDEQRQFVETIYTESDRLSSLVEDLLSLSRLDAGKVRLNRWIVSLNQIVKELTSQLNTQLLAHKLLLSVPKLPPVYVDRDKVKQVVFNLLTNAIKYSPQGGEIVLTMHEADMDTLPPYHAEGRWILTEISDEGIGIAPEDLNHIWERFYRVDNTNTRRIGGTGLGLSITRALVQLHGGDIWVTSTPGEGSCFSFTLPIFNEGAPTE